MTTRYVPAIFDAEPVDIYYGVRNKQVVGMLELWV